jgi:intracellular multiplication protein IcmX
MADEPDDLNLLLTNLGAYLGYDLTAQIDWSPVNALLDIANATLMEQGAFITVFGAIPVNAYSSALSTFVPSGTTYATVNDMSNYTFSSGTNAGGYETSSSSGSIAVNPLIDQSTYQKDPTNQAILNILGTPSYSYCMNNDSTAWLSSCNYVYNTSVTSSVIGPLPQANQFFTYDYNEAIIPQLNSNTLLAPLLYDMSSPPTSGGSDGTQTTQGLAANNQAQEAVNFIRYATYATSPVPLPNLLDYSNAYTTATATTTDATTSLTDIINAQNSITSYLSSLRTYAAQASVPVSNLYSILSKRMPQQSGTDTSTLTSQALSEFQMATRRIYNPAQSKDNQWINQINTASSATIQKEMAILLSEINYQLYLNRQQQERELMTVSILLLQSLRQSAPDFGSQSGAGASTTDAPTDPTTDTPTDATTPPTAQE